MGTLCMQQQRMIPSLEDQQKQQRIEQEKISSQQEQQQSIVKEKEIIPGFDSEQIKDEEWIRNILDLHKQLEQQVIIQQLYEKRNDILNYDENSDDTEFTVNKQFQIGVINPTLTYDYSELKKNENNINVFLGFLSAKKVLKTSPILDHQLLATFIKSPYTHQLVQMVHIAYYSHFPLRFSPDNIQLLINQVFAEHIKGNAEKFREKFVSHQGKKALLVLVNHLDVDRYDWPNIIKQFSKQIKQHIGKEKYQLCVHKYSTTDFIAKTCYEISLMDTMQSYFSYGIRGGCGISKIKLLGTLEDWIKLKENAQKLREFELGHWIDQLDPILDQFIRLYQGDIDTEFWGDIYRYQPKGEPYSNIFEYATGWIIVDPDSLPTGLSNAPVVLTNRITGEKVMDLDFSAGFLGVGLDEDGFLYPYQGWAVLQK